MQHRFFRRVLRVLMIPAALSPLLAGCSNADDPYAKLADAPLVQGRLHTVTLVSADASLADRLQKAGYRAMPLPPNYPEADLVLGVLWNVPAPVAKEATVYDAPGAGPNVRLLVQPLPPAAPPADADVERSFFRNVLATDVPRRPDAVALGEGVHVQVWTYQVPSIVEARKRLRANSIPVVTEPVGITTPYLGDQKSMSLRAPDGTIVELVETVAQ
jgi:hypothetical protein